VVLRLAALEALARRQATPEMIATIAPEPNLWPSSAYSTGSASCKHAAAGGTRGAAAQALAALETRFTETGKRLNFSTEDRDDLWWMMTSADTNAVRALLALMPEPAWRDRLPKLVSGALARQQTVAGTPPRRTPGACLRCNAISSSSKRRSHPARAMPYSARDGRVVDWNSFPKGATAFLPLGNHPATLKLRHEGEGQPYVSVTTFAAVADHRAGAARLQRQARNRGRSTRKRPENGDAATCCASASKSKRATIWAGSSSTTRCRPAPASWLAARSAAQQAADRR
jgi:alpha-2-macroglobulin